MKNQILCDGDVMTFVAPSGGVTSGTPVIIGALFVIPQSDAAQGALFSGVLEGNLTIAKKTGVAPAQGAKAYWDDTAKAVTTAATSGYFLVGTFANAYLSADTSAEVRMDGTALTANP